MKIEELTKENCIEFLKGQRVGRLACSNDNQPYIVPLFFVFDGIGHIYVFSTVGQKIKWMRENPQVCFEVEDIENQNNWTTIVIFGYFEELPDQPQFYESRRLAHKLLSKYPMWWQPAFAAEAKRAGTNKESVYFRIKIEKLTGNRTLIEEGEINL
jgi:nitroimidazol reductase NimA-like FMN-containing flavoprotein (pyridoxamine 5'-phosphate oxidase superfamily)